MLRNMWTRSVQVVLATSVGLLMNRACAAQVLHHISQSQVQVGSWTFCAAYTTDAAGVDVDNLLALADLSTTTGENLIAVWYQRQPDNTWSSKSWDTADPVQAAKSFGTSLAVPDQELSDWLKGPSGAIVTIDAKDYSNGLLADDALQEIVDSSPDPESMVEYLVSLGYKAAITPADKSDSCSSSIKLGVVAAEAANLLGAPSGAVLTFSSSGSLCVAQGTGPIGTLPTLPTKPTTAPPWSPPGTVPTAPIWVPGT